MSLPKLTSPPADDCHRPPVRKSTSITLAEISENGLPAEVDVHQGLVGPGRPCSRAPGSRCCSWCRRSPHPSPCPRTWAQGCSCRSGSWAKTGSPGSRGSWSGCRQVARAGTPPSRHPALCRTCKHKGRDGRGKCPGELVHVRDPFKVNMGWTDVAAMQSANVIAKSVRWHAHCQPLGRAQGPLCFGGRCRTGDCGEARTRDPRSLRRGIDNMDRDPLADTRPPRRPRRCELAPTPCHS